MIRARRSFCEPAPTVTHRTGLFGYFCCACARPAAAASATPIAIAVDNLTRCGSAMESPLLLRWYACVFHHFCPPRRLGFDESGEVLRRRSSRIDAQLLDAPLKLGHAQCLDHIRVELHEHRLWRRCRRAQAVPDGDIESRQARLGNG